MIHNKTKVIFGLIFLIGIFMLPGCRNGITSTTENQLRLSEYNIIWDSPSKNHNGSMPIGNGDIGLNVWVEENGDISFYIGKTDSWGDNGRLLKVGKVRVQCDPAIVFPDARFRQELDLGTGTILLSSEGMIRNKPAEISFKIWVDANNPVIHITHQSSIPLSMSASIEMWRTAPDTLSSIGVSDLLEDRTKPGNLSGPVIVEPDHIIQNSDNYIGWYHHNQKSVGFDLTNELQGLSEYFKEDPILHRTFGAIITGTESESVDDATLQTASDKKGRLNVYVLTQHPADPGAWQTSIENLANDIESTPIPKRQKAHEEWWSGFWERSWIHAESAESSKPAGDTSDAFIVSRAYTLQRFINASAGRGNYPIKFNGSLFTVLYPGVPGGADFRQWGPGYWWQNTRLPYTSMCMAGDYDLMQPFFKMYAEEIFELCEYRTKKYFGIDGAYYPECMYFWGSVFTGDYGWVPFEERPDKLQESGWHKWEWVAGLELAFMMLDYYDYTMDTDFLKEKVLPVANGVIKFFDNYYELDESGKLLMHPSQALETWWDCDNPMSELAGLYSITSRLLALPENLTSEQDRNFWISLEARLPEIPLRETPSGTALAPAERFENKMNFENPELYAVFPFRLFGLGKPNMEWALNALEHRWDEGSFGWRQDDVFMAYMGLTDQARDYLYDRSKTFHKGSRFPAFWGPNFDWIPDQDHGGILMKAFQSMLMQVDPYSRKIYLLPAWPDDWNADFKLNAPYNTTIVGSIKNGEIETLTVTPDSRKDDVIIKPNQ